jgi:serine protease Do
MVRGAGSRPRVAWGARLACILAVCTLALSACWPQQLGVRRLGPDEVFEVAKPAVVIVEADNAVTWSIPAPDFTADKQKALEDRLVAMVLAGQIPLDENAIKEAGLKLLLDDPGSWFSAGTTRVEETDSVYSLGTGFFVTEDGYLLTNDHVVETTPDTIKALMLDEMERLNRSPSPKDLATFRDSVSSDVGVPVTDAQALNLLRWTIGVFKADLRILSVKPTYRVGFGNMTADEVGGHGAPAELVTHGGAAPERDIAVLKIAGGPYPSLPVTSSAPLPKAQLTTVGYPCKCTDTTVVDPALTLTPVETHGSFHGKVSMPTGWNALGTDVHAEHGNSGGPVIDDSGHVVGVMTASDGPESIAVPMEVARQFTSRAGVRPVQGELGQSYAQAVAEFHQQHYRRALPLFRSVAGRMPRSADADVQRYIADSTRAIAAGRDRTPPTLAELLPYVGAAASGVVVLAALVIVLVVGLRRRRRRPPA